MHTIILTNRQPADLPARLRTKVYGADMTAIDIPAWPDPETPEGVTFFANAMAIVAAWRAHGVGDHFALGMLANAEAESSLDPNAKGDHVKGEPTAFGIHQWHAPRLAAIKRATGADILADVLAGKGNVQTQVEAAWWELSNFPAGYGVNAISAAASPYMAAYQACALFERAGAADAAQRRGQMATRWAAWFQERF